MGIVQAFVKGILATLPHDLRGLGTDRVDRKFDRVMGFPVAKAVAWNAYLLSQRLNMDRHPIIVELQSGSMRFQFAGYDIKDCVLRDFAHAAKQAVFLRHINGTRTHRSGYSWPVLNRDLQPGLLLLT